MPEFLHLFVDRIVDMVNDIGYIGIFIGMLLESTLVPIPSELVMIPAGIAAVKGDLNIYLVIVAGILGNIAGAAISYHISDLVGRDLVLKYGKYFFFKPKTLEKMEKFFENNGSISIFFGRLLPGFRHFISIPAGIAKMDLRKFYFYTFIGSAIWTSILAVLGYWIGDNIEMINYLVSKFILIIMIAILVVTVIYLRLTYRKTKINL